MESEHGVLYNSVTVVVVKGEVFILMIATTLFLSAVSELKDLALGDMQQGWRLFVLVLLSLCLYLFRDSLIQQADNVRHVIERWEERAPHGRRKRALNYIKHHLNKKINVCNFTPQRPPPLPPPPQKCASTSIQILSSPNKVTLPPD